MTHFIRSVTIVCLLFWIYILKDDTHAYQNHNNINDNLVQDDGNIPLPPDVSNHRNINLLPKNCGPMIVVDKVYGGDNAGLSEFPWMVLLSYRASEGRAFLCGGAIINEKWVLTAAHCVRVVNYPLVNVRAGEHDIQSTKDCETTSNGKVWCAPPVQEASIEEVKVHPQYSSVRRENDIALIRVSGFNLTASNVKPICLPIDARSREAKLKYTDVAGWGKTEHGQSSNILQKLTLVPIVNLRQCQEIFKNFSQTITYKQICAGGREGKDTCKGDSGGPLQVPGYLNGAHRYIQQGVVSFGYLDCGTKGIPGVYTKVAYYMDWILDTIY